MNAIFNDFDRSTAFYEEECLLLIKGDSLKILKDIKEHSINMIFADPPYFLSSNGITCKSGKMQSVNKGIWDTEISFSDMNDFNDKWIKECYRILDYNGTIWISGTMHNIYSIGFCLQNNGFRILNNITWYKHNAPPNLSCRYFKHSTETVIWAKKSKKSKHYFDYQRMKELNGGKQMSDLWQINTVKRSEKKFGNFPTQKPLELLTRIIMSSTSEGDIILDPFNGSGTTGVSAKSLGRQYIGIDTEESYLQLSINRLKNIIS